MSNIKHVCKKSDLPFARGNVKKAYEVKECVDFASDKDATQIVIVNFTGEIKWINPSKPSNLRQNTPNGNQIIKFKTKMINEPQFKYDIRKLIDRLIADREATKTPIVEEFPEINNLDKLMKWFDENDQQFEYINELKKMNELSKLGLAPELYQIRINNEAPFSPDEIDAKIAEIKDGEPVQISYMAEKCGMRYPKDIMEFVKSYPMNDDDVARKVCEFCDKFVDTTESVNCDFKYQNLCPMIVETSKSSHEIVSIRMLDVDPKYAIENKENPDFSRHAKVFMKFLMFAHLYKKGVNFFRWGVSPGEVREMIAFFYGMDYMIYEFNPINMMYHYLIKTSGEEKTGFDNLKTKFPEVEQMTAVFEPYIRIARPFDVAKGGKKRKSKKAKKARKAKHTHRGR
jgi:hypothetical protein